MAVWTAPVTWAADKPLSVANLNEQLRDNMLALKAGVFTRQAVWYVAGTISAGTNKSAQLEYRGPVGTIKRATLVIKTAPVGCDLIVDINIAGTSIWNVTQANRVHIDDGATSATQTTFDDASIADGEVLTFDVDQVGSGTAGSDLSLLLEIEATIEVS